MSAYNKRYCSTKLCNGAHMAIFGDFFASCICSEPCAAHFRPTSKIRTKATPCVEVWQASNLQRLRLGEERKKEERKKKSQGKNIMVCPTPQGDHNEYRSTNQTYTYRRRAARCVVFAATWRNIKPRSHTGGQRNATQRKTTHGAA